MEKLFQDLERLVEIEALVADLENTCLNLEEDIDYEKSELNYAKIQLLSLDSPNFFQKLMPAKLENQREQARSQVRAHTAALEQAKRELESKCYSLESLKEEYQTLLPRREEYAAGKGSFPAELEQHLACFEGIQLASRVLFYLEDLGKYMRGDARRGEVTHGYHVRGDRKLECLAEAARYAKPLKEVLDRFPTPLKLKGSYLSWPDHYVTEPTSPYAQLDRMNQAIDTVRDVRKQLQELL